MTFACGDLLWMRRTCTYVRVQMSVGSCVCVCVLTCVRVHARYRDFTPQRLAPGVTRQRTLLICCLRRVIQAREPNKSTTTVQPGRSRSDIVVKPVIE